MGNTNTTRRQRAPFSSAFDHGRSRFAGARRNIRREARIPTDEAPKDTADRRAKAAELATSVEEKGRLAEEHLRYFREAKLAADAEAAANKYKNESGNGMRRVIRHDEISGDGDVDDDDHDDDDDDQDQDQDQDEDDGAAAGQASGHDQRK